MLTARGDVPPPPPPHLRRWLRTSTASSRVAGAVQLVALYIAIYATKVNRNRWSEVRKLTKRLSGEFLLLQVTFLLGIIFAGTGIGAVMTIKVTDEDMSWVTFLLSVAMMLLMVYMLFQIIRKVLMINRFVDKVRKERTEKFSSETEKTLVEEMGK